MLEESGQDDRFQRWQRIRIDHFSYAQNLILTFTVAALGYWFALLRDSVFPSPAARCAMLFALLALGLSAISGLACVLNRLWDFRGTAKRTRNEADMPTIEKLRILGRLTWALLYIQFAAFCCGIVLMATALLLTYGGKLA